MLSLVQLRCFVAVAQDLNLRRAARRLNMTQPPLTRHIQALERAVGTALLDRSRRAIALTPAGSALARAGQRILDQVAEAGREALQIGRGDVGTLSIAFTAASSYGFVPGLIMAIRKAFPDVALTLRELTTPQQIEALRAGQADLCLLRPPVSLPGIETWRVFREGMVLALPDSHPLLGQTRVGVADLVGETLITYPPVEGPYFHRLVMNLLHAAGVTPRAVQYVTQTHSMLALVGAGLGVAIVPQAAERWCPTGVRLRDLAGAEAVHADLVLAWTQESPNPACRRVLAVLPRLMEHAETARTRWHAMS